MKLLTDVQFLRYGANFSTTDFFQSISRWL
jgi:hypothetical protein